MRLTSSEIQAIKAVVASFDPTAQIYLYGSRVDNTKQGGDIDLLILSKHIPIAPEDAIFSCHLTSH